jgi:hypothetical protein
MRDSQQLEEAFCLANDFLNPILKQGMHALVILNQLTSLTVIRGNPEGPWCLCCGDFEQNTVRSQPR